MDFSECNLFSAAYFSPYVSGRVPETYGVFYDNKNKILPKGETDKMKKIKFSAEICYLCAIIVLAFSVAMLTAADFGISMIVAPAYLLSLKTGFLTFGQAEYVIQAGVFIVLCLVLRKFKFVYAISFVTCLIYGAVLDLWRLIPFFNPSVTAPGSMNMPLRIFMFVAGVLLTAFSITLFFKTYLYPQVYDFFVEAVAVKYGIKISIFKTIFDLTCLAVSLIMTFCFFGKLEGVNFGTVIMAVINGTIIGLFSKLIDKIFDKFAALFELDSDKKLKNTPAQKPQNENEVEG